MTKEEPMTWEELCKKAREMGLFVSDDDSTEPAYIRFGDLLFTQKGQIILSDTDYGLDLCCVNHLMSNDRTPKQMLAIMEALQ